MGEGHAVGRLPVDPDARSRELMGTAAAAELLLLRQERKAERRLAEARAALERDRARLTRAESRVHRRLEDVAQAEAELRERQAERAAGPRLPQG